MTMMWIVAGGIIGLVFVMFLMRKWNKSEVKDKIKGKVITCPECSANMAEKGRWQRGKLRGGQLFVCNVCGKKSTWDIDHEAQILLK